MKSLSYYISKDKDEIKVMKTETDPIPAGAAVITVWVEDGCVYQKIVYQEPTRWNGHVIEVM